MACRISALLTALGRQDANISLTSGLNYGPGLNATSTGNVGNELNVAGFATGATQQTALTSNDYLTFSVQSITGITMLPDSISFTLWRQGSGSAPTMPSFPVSVALPQANSYAKPYHHRRFE